MIASHLNWNGTILFQLKETKQATDHSSNKRTLVMSNRSDVVVMRDLMDTYDDNLFVPMKTGIDVLDEFWSSKNGVMPSTITMVVGDAGVGKTTMLMVLLSHLQKNGYNCLFVSAEMDEIDFADYCFRFEEFKDVPMLFPEFDGPDIVDQLNDALETGYDVVVIDSFVELKELICDQRNITKSRASNFITSIMKKYKGGVKRYYHEDDRVSVTVKHMITASGPGIQRDGFVDRRQLTDVPFVDSLESERQALAKNQAHHTHYTSFLVIQQVLKSGKFAGSNSLKHLVSAFLELRFDPDGRTFLKFKKNRRGAVDEKLYYTIKERDFKFDKDRRQRDKDAYDWSEREAERQEKEKKNVSSISDLLKSGGVNSNNSDSESKNDNGETNERDVDHETHEQDRQFESFNFRNDLDPDTVSNHLDDAGGNVSATLRSLKAENVIPDSMSRYKLQTFIDENGLERITYSSSNDRV